MSRTYRLGPSDSIPRGLAPGSTVVFTAHDTPHRAFSLSGVKGTDTEPISFQWEPGARTRGESEFGVRVNDGCAFLHFLDADISVAGHGVRATRTPGMVFRGGRYHGCGVEGIHIGQGCDGFLIENIEALNNGVNRRWSGYTEDQCHGVYACSQGIIRLSSLIGNRGSGVQINGASLGYIISKFLMEDCLLERNGSGGTPALQLAAVCDSNFLRLRFVRNNATITMWGEGKSRFACKRNRLAELLVDGPGKHLVDQLDGSSDNQFVNSPGFPGNIVEATPGRLPPVAVPVEASSEQIALQGALAKVHALELRLAELEEKRDRAMEALR